MKTFKFIVTVVMCCVLGIGLYSVNKHFQVKEKSNNLLLANVEAITTTEFPGRWCPNFTMQTVWYKSSIGVQFIKPDISVSWTSMSCCVNSVPSNACDFSSENSECKNKVPRNAECEHKGD